MTYHETKDLLYVKSMLGHRYLRSMLRYIQPVNFRSESKL